MFLYKDRSGYTLSFWGGVKVNIYRSKGSAGKTVVCEHKKTKGSDSEISFKTFSSLSETIRRNCYKLPSDIDLIVGVPRSGIIPAYMLGLFLNKKVCSLDEFISGIWPWSGDRPIRSCESIKNILIVDDSVYSGSSLRKVQESLRKHFSKDSFNFRFLCVYATKQSADLVDFYFEIVEQPRLFQWNYLNHSISGQCCFDMDGVLCQDPTLEENDDGPKYKDFIKNAKPLFIPQYEIYAIVTSRLEKYREETEEWLLKHNVKYKHLFMLNLNSAEERRKLRCHATFKAKIYCKLRKTVCFIESDPVQAKQISNLSGKPVICVATDECFINQPS